MGTHHSLAELRGASRPDACLLAPPKQRRTRFTVAAPRRIHRTRGIEFTQRSRREQLRRIAWAMAAAYDPATCFAMWERQTPCLPQCPDNR